MSLYCVSRPARGREMRRKVTTFPAICKIRDEKTPHFYPKTEKSGIIASEDARSFPIAPSNPA